MNKLLWIVQSLVGVAFTMAGVIKLSTPYDALAEQMSWVPHVPAMAVKLIGLVEVAGGLGLILPSVFRIMPGLTPLAAAGLVLTMISAAGLHISIGEAAHIAPNLVLGSLAALVAWGRHKKAPIAPR
jgi:uncharacterized membrane protein